MIRVTPELKIAAEKYRERFGDNIGLEQMPAHETADGLIKNIEKCLDANKNLLPEIYGWNNNHGLVY